MSLPACGICCAALGSHHVAWCTHWGQVLPSECPGAIKAAVETVLLRERVESLYGVELFARALAESEPLVSGYVRLHGHVMHLREIHALCRAAVAALGTAPALPASHERASGSSTVGG